MKKQSMEKFESWKMIELSYDFMKSICFGLLSLGILSCNVRKTESHNEPPIVKPIVYDTIKFNRIFVPDTTGCMWIVGWRMIIDTLRFEKAIVSEDSILTTEKYKRLITCNLPSFILAIKDTFLISGNVYGIYSFEQQRGFPAILNKIVYSATR